MGNTSSNPRDEARQRRLELEESGVLLPPSFGVVSEQLSLLSRAATARHHVVVGDANNYNINDNNNDNEDDDNDNGGVTIVSPSYLQPLMNQKSTAHQLLTDYMRPGIAISTMAAPKTNLLVACQFPPDKPYDDEIVALQHSFGRGGGGNVGVQLHSNGVGQLNFLYAAPLFFNQSLVLNGRYNVAPQKTAWLGLQTQTALDLNKTQQNNDDAITTPFKPKYPLTLQLGCGCGFTKQKLHASIACLSANVPGCTLAVEGFVPWKTYDAQQRFYLSCNLAQSNEQQNTASNKKDRHPPLVLELFKGSNLSTDVSMLRLGQTLTFDRYVLNPMEDRCPKIKNTFGWAVEMKQQSSKNVANDFTTVSMENRSTSLRGAVAWQWNRAVALKLMGETNSDHQRSLTGAILFKRWQQPSIVASILVGGEKLAFRGIGFEIEIGDDSGSRNDYYKYNDNQQVHGPNPQVPETKPTLPGEM